MSSFPTPPDRMQRLDALTIRLKADGHLITRDLAEELGVSVRTLHRDIQLLRSRGLPVETERGRGGGVRLPPHWGIGRMALSYGEAVDMLVSLAVVEQMKSPFLMANLSSIRLKLIASFSPESRRRIRQLKSRILTGQPASLAVLESYRPPSPRIVEKLHQAFLEMKVVYVSYADEQGRRTERRVEPHYLLVNYPVWYMLAWDRHREAIRTFRCDRVRSIDIQGDSFRLKSAAEFQATLKDLEGTLL